MIVGQPDAAAAELLTQNAILLPEAVDDVVLARAGKARPQRLEAAQRRPLQGRPNYRTRRALRPHLAYLMDTAGLDPTALDLAPITSRRHMIGFERTGEIEGLGI